MNVIVGTCSSDALPIVVQTLKVFFKSVPIYMIVWLDADGRYARIIL